MDPVPHTDPSDWSFKPLKELDGLLRCPICFEYYQTAVVMPNCSHSYCSLCIRRHLALKPHCPICTAPASDSQLKNAKVLDDIIGQFTKSRAEFMSLVKTQALSIKRRNGILSGGGDGASTSDCGSVERKNTAMQADMVAPLDGGSASPDLYISLGDGVWETPNSGVKKEKEEGEEGEGKKGEEEEEEEEDSSGCELIDLPSFRETPTPIKGKQCDSSGLDSSRAAKGEGSSTRYGGGIDGTTPSRWNSAYKPSDHKKGGAKAVPKRKSLSFSIPAKRPDSCKLTLSKQHTDTTSVSVTPPPPPPPSPFRVGGSSSIEHCTSDVESPLVGNLQPPSSSSPALTLSTGKVECPVCSKGVDGRFINHHLDTCLATSTSTPEASPHPSPDVSVVQPHRKKLPKLLYTIMKDKELRKKLKEHGLPASGSRQVLIFRLQEYSLRYNAECDSAHPKSAHQIAQEVIKAEKTKQGIKTKTPRATTLNISKDSSAEEIEQERKRYAERHKEHFAKLIASAKAKKGLSKKEEEEEEEEETPSSDEGGGGGEVIRRSPPVTRRKTPQQSTRVRRSSRLNRTPATKGKDFTALSSNTETSNEDDDDSDFVPHTPSRKRVLCSGRPSRTPATKGKDTTLSSDTEDDDVPNSTSRKKSRIQ